MSAGHRWCAVASRNGANLNIEMDMTPLLHGVKVLDDRLDGFVATTFDRQATIAQGWMKDNAPWTDRTGNARQGLSTVTDHEARKRHTLHLFGRMPYNIWLEVRFAGRYAVIVPALIDQGPKLMGTLNRIFRRLGGA